MSPEKRRASREKGPTAQRRATEFKHVTRTKSILAAGGVLGLMVLGGIVINRGCEVSSRSDTLTTPSAALVTPNVQRSHEIIRGEIQRLGIQRSATEWDRWNRSGYFPFGKVAVTKETQAQAAEIIQATLTTMGQSENPFYRQATDYLRPLVFAGEVQLTVPTTLVTSEDNIVIAMSTGVRIERYRLIWDLTIPADYVLNANSITLANSFVHESNHIENGRTFQESLPSNLSAEKRLGFEIERRETSRIAEEARGNGQEAKAIIYQSGLLGEKAIHWTDLEEAAEFIKLGSDVNSPAYRRYVAVTLLRLPDDK